MDIFEQPQQPPEQALIPFGKYRGQPLLQVASTDPQYLEWLVAQGWFAQRYPTIHNLIINNFGPPQDTPEHNAMQVRFLDDDYTWAFLRGIIYLTSMAGGPILGVEVNYPHKEMNMASETQKKAKIEEIRYEFGSNGPALEDGGWINGTVHLSDGRIICAGGGWVDRGGWVKPYSLSEAGDVDELAEALGVEEDEAHDMLCDDCPGEWDLEPECPESEDGAHDWQAPYEIVGGIKENPGVWGNGGGVIIYGCCMRCGCRRTTDTWAQDMSTGEQGLRAVTYEPGYYADDLRRLTGDD